MASDPFQPLETARLLLRCVAAEDAAMTTMMMTPEVSRWVANWPVPFTHEMAAARIESSRELAWTGDALPFAVTDKSSGGLVGWAIIDRDRNDHRRGSFGYWLGEKHHGKGYMKEIAPVALAAGFDLLNLDVIETGAQPENTASFAIMKACGMKPIGEAMVYAPTRGCDERCYVYEIRRASVV